MSPLTLPEDIKKELHFKIQTWYDKNKDCSLYTEGEMNQIQRLLDYIEVLDKGHVFAPDDKNLLFKDFKSFYTQYDQRRGKNFVETFPELADWYNSIEIATEYEVKPLTIQGIKNYETGVYQP